MFNFFSKKKVDFRMFIPKPTVSLLTAAKEMTTVKESTKVNSAISSLNIYTTFAILASGMSGDSLKELTDFFGLESDVKDYVTALLTSLKENHKGSQLLMSNAVFTCSEIDPAFVKQVRTTYNAAAIKVNFEKCKDALVVINDTISKDTHGKIPSLLSEDALNTQTKIVLVSALYFKSNWLHAFDKTKTKPAPFYLTSDANIEPISVPTMHGTIQAGWFKKESVLYLILLFEDNGIKFIVEMDSNSKALPSQMNLEYVHELGARSTEEYKKVDVCLPKFILESTVDLAKVLPPLGLKKIFAPSMDFKKIYTGASPMEVSSAVHKVVVEVNEVGAEAVAATAVVATARSIPVPNLNFVVDHPFNFHILSSAENVILFSGSVRNPMEK